ncbi:MAG: ADP-ribosylglycohydrolase family protein [Mycobacteriales bacterium]
MHDALSARDMLSDELTQRRQTGHDAEGIAARAEAADPGDSIRQWELVDELAHAERTGEWPYVEPDRLEDILATLPPAGDPATIAEAVYRDKVHGAWLGRCAGCNLGKPVENGDHWTSRHIRDYLESTGAYPLSDYFPVADPMPAGFEFRPNWPHTTRGNIHGSARDDDIDYPIVNLHVLETYGPSYRASDVGHEWLMLLPFLQTYTAERVAIRNLIHGLAPPETASYRNPYREWIGAQIRADIFGWVNPGNPRRAALLAYEDAALSHVGNGIYGEMWSAALNAAAFTSGTPRAAVEESLKHIPPRSRLAEALRSVLTWHADGRTWEEAQASIERDYGHYHWVHTINNAAAVAAGILWADGDYTRAIGLTVQAGMDTDSNGATAGSVGGVLSGAAALPGHWVEPLADSVRSAVFGFDNSQISDLADRTIGLRSSLYASD